MKTNYMFMAFAKGSESVEGAPIKRYVGIAPVTVLAVNPDKTTLEKIYNTTLEKTPEYLGLAGDEKKVPQVRVEFIVKTVEEKCNVNLISKVTFFVNKEYQYNRDKTKVKVINKYGETTWLPIENVKTKTIPENLSWFEPADFRPAYVGEENLTLFIKQYLGIPNKSYKDAGGNVVEIKDKANAEARLDCIDKYFTGDVSELRDAIAMQPNNKVKVMFGVRTTSDNKQYQTVYTDMFLKYSSSYTQAFEKSLNERKSMGAYPTTEFFVGDLKEYVVEPTDLAVTNNKVPEMPDFGDMPFPEGL